MVRLLTPAEIEPKAESIAANKINTKPVTTFVLAIMAGAFIALGGTFMLVVQSDSSLGFTATKLLSGFVFCLGLFLVIGAGAELFTGSNLMVTGLLSKKFSLGVMLKNWAIVLVGNAVGACSIVLLLLAADIGSLNGDVLWQTAMTVAEGKAELSLSTAFTRGILCNFLVCLAVWVSYSADSVTDKFFAVLLPVTAFVACGFEHSIANVFFFSYAGILQLTGVVGVLSVSTVLVKLFVVLLGNVVGGALFVGVAYWFAYKRNATVE